MNRDVSVSHLSDEELKTIELAKSLCHKKLRKVRRNLRYFQRYAPATVSERAQHQNLIHTEEIVLHLLSRLENYDNALAQELMRDHAPPPLATALTAMLPQNSGYPEQPSRIVTGPAFTGPYVRYNHVQPGHA